MLEKVLSPTGDLLCSSVGPYSLRLQMKSWKMFVTPKRPRSDAPGVSRSCRIRLSVSQFLAAALQLSAA